MLGAQESFQNSSLKRRSIFGSGAPVLDMKIWHGTSVIYGYFVYAKKNSGKIRFYSEISLFRGKIFTPRAIFTAIFYFLARTQMPIYYGWKALGENIYWCG